MTHLHAVYDADTYFIIDATTRSIENVSQAKKTIIQGDHNSERLTFEVPRFVDGHDMTLCTKIKVHFNNISADKKSESRDVYEVDDVQISSGSDDVVVFSWLISGNATVYAGILSFLIEFECLTGSTVDYAWHTGIYSNITVGDGMNNGDAVLRDYSDILEAWKLDVMERYITLAEADERYARNGAAGSGGTGITITDVSESTEDGGNNVITFSDGTSITVKNGRTGAPGEQGEQGEQGPQGEPGPQGDPYILTEADKAEIAEIVKRDCISKNQGASNVGKIHVVGTDGNLVLVDMPKGASGDVTGNLDDSKNILLSGNLADGEYPLKWLMEDGTYSDAGTLTVGKIEQPEEIKNWIPISTDASGNVYNGTGYKSGVRLSSDGVTEKSSEGKLCVLTGYIPVSNGDIIRTKGVTFGGDGQGYISYLWCYNEAFGKVSMYSHADGVYGTVADGIYTITVPNTAGIAYIRLQAQTLDGNSIVTKNQEIV